jgi:Cupin-like domain/JmjC domain, hydroxylase
MIESSCNCVDCIKEDEKKDKILNETRPMISKHSIDYTNKNEVHSEIHHYPIDYEKYPLAKDCIEYTYEVNSGEFIIIPSGWHHWIFTEPNTLAISYTIRKMNFVDLSNVFYKSMKESVPYVGKMDNKYDINYAKFFRASIDCSFVCMFSQNYKCCPVYKDYDYNTFKYYSTLNNIIDISNYRKLFAYVGMDNINKDNILNEYNDIKNFIPNELYDMVRYCCYIWFTLNNKIDSGLHYDSTQNILYVLDGKKTVRLFPPDCSEKLYIKVHEYINLHIGN